MRRVFPSLLCALIQAEALAFAPIPTSFATVQLHSSRRSGTSATMSDSWEQMWARGLERGQFFDAKIPSPALTSLLENKQLPKADGGGKALVPGCGRGYDVIAFATAGYSAVGLDISPTAVAAAKAFAKETAPHLTEKDAQFSQADFFELTAEKETDKYHVVLDYTFLCALHPTQRELWAVKIKSLLAEGGELVTIIFPLVEKEGGPPFAMSIGLLKGLLEPLGFEAKSLEMLPDNMCHEGRQGKTALGRWTLASGAS